MERAALLKEGKRERESWRVERAGRDADAAVKLEQLGKNWTVYRLIALHCTILYNKILKNFSYTYME